MKNTKILLFIVLALSAPLFCFASAEFSFSPSTGEYRQGQTISVSIFVNPQDVDIYTVKAELTFASDKLEVRTFRFGNKWLAVSQPGYDLIDNKAGSLIKTAGFPGGLSGSALFGTISFYVKNTGSAKISFADASIALDKSNQNVLQGNFPQALFSLIQPLKTAPKTSAPSATVSQEPAETEIEKSPDKEELVELNEQGFKSRLSPDKEKVILYAQLAFFSLVAWVLANKIVLYVFLISIVLLVVKLIFRFR